MKPSTFSAVMAICIKTLSQRYPMIFLTVLTILLTMGINQVRADDVLFDNKQQSSQVCYTLTIVDHLGNTISTTQYYEGDEVAAVDAPPTDDCSDDYTFDGWSESSVAYNSLTYKKVTFPYIMPANDVTFYPVYRLNNTEDYHRVTYDLGADNWEGDYLIAAGPQYFAYGKNADLSVVDMTSAYSKETISASKGDDKCVSLVSVEGGYVLKTQDGKYNYIRNTEGYGISSTDHIVTAEPYPLAVKFIDQSNIAIYSQTHPLNLSLRCHLINKNFRFYQQNKQTKVYLYKKSPLYTTPLPCSKLEANDAVVTSTAGQTIKVNVPITVTSALSSTINITAQSDNEHFTATPLDNISAGEHIIAVHYTPAADVTTDGIEIANITLTASHGNSTTTFQVTGRHLPENFVIAAKWGDNWYVLPADITSESITEGLLIEVDNPADPTKALAAPNTTKYGLKSVYTSTSTADRYSSNGERLVFVENISGNNKTLYNNGGDDQNSNNANIQVDAQYTTATGGYYNTNPDRYEWIPSTTNLKDYTLTSAHTFAGETARTISLDDQGIFGTLLQDKSYNGMVRLLPVDNFYNSAELQVVEWKENSVVIMYNGTPDQQATLAINGVNVGSAQLSAAKKDFAVYELPANGLVNQPTKRLLITIGSEQKWLTIPYIISGEKTDAEVVAATSAEIATATDVFILKGAKFTATATSKNSQYRFRNVTVYGGGKLVIGSGKFLSMNSIILRAGGITAAGEYDYVYPQFDLQGTLTNSAGEFKYDYITDYEHWYHLVLPFDGKIESPSIKYPVEFYGNNVSATNSGSWVVKRYDGATRATGNYDAWVDIESENADVITAGHGYIYWGAPKKVKVNGEEKRQKWGIQRIVMKKSWEDARDAEIGNKTISGLGSYANVDNNSDNVYDQGWNLIGNPYMVNLTGLNSSSLKAGQLIEELDANGNWTGGWVLDSIDAQLRYITIPSDHFEWYTAEKVSKNMTLVSGRAFFVQIAGGATDIMFEASNRARLMPALRAAHNDEPVDIETGIVLSSETMQDEVNFWISDGLTNDYEYNADYPKTLNTTNFNIYGVHTNGDLSWVATGPEFAKESMPIGYQVPAAGTYMLSISEDYYSEDLDALYITDHEKSPELTVDLMSNPYEFSVNQAETNNTRFTVALRLKLDDDGTITGLENIGADNDSLMKFIYQDKMYILHHGVIYDATGKRVTTINK